MIEGKQQAAYALRPHLTKPMSILREPARACSSLCQFACCSTHFTPQHARLGHLYQQMPVGREEHSCRVCLPDALMYHFTFQQGLSTSPCCATSSVNFTSCKPAGKAISSLKYAVCRHACTVARLDVQPGNACAESTLGLDLQARMEQSS